MNTSRFLHLNQFDNSFYLNIAHITMFMPVGKTGLRIITTCDDEATTFTFSSELIRDACINYITGCNVQSF